ncbi:hypothetical protein BG000_003871 [Podila horticola]|nr:hypothetical protein BG000_003871 [Podila horticola]
MQWFSSLPTELQDMTFSRLDQNTLTNCARKVRCTGHSPSTPAETLDLVVADDEEEFKTLQALIRWNPRLTSLALRSGIVSPSLLLTAASEASRLQSLYIGMSVPIFLARDVLNSLPSSIQSVTMYLSKFNLEEILPQAEEIKQEQEQDEVPHQNVYLWEEKPSRIHKALETLQIYGSFSLLEQFLFLPFLETCSSKLIHLECPEARYFFDQDVNGALTKIGHFLQQLELHVSGCGNISSKDLQSILCKARQLEKLVAIDKDNILFQDPTLLAKDITGSIWATSTLQHFECRIIADPKRHKRTHRKVYQQLGAQSNLKRIILGHPLDPRLNDPPFQLDCLDLTLESGLEELEGLVKLQELSVMSLTHGIGVPELE